MESDTVRTTSELSHSGDSLKMILTRNPYLKPLPLFLKPHKLSPERDTFIRGNTKFSSQYPLGLDRYYSPLEHGSRKRKRMPFKMSSQDTESSDEGEDWSPEAEALSHSPYQNARSGLAFKRDTDMIDLSRIHLYKTLGGFNSTQVKREPDSPEPLWSPSPVLMPPPPAYFPPLHPNWIPLPFLMRGPVIPLSPHGFYQKESLLRHRRAQGRAGGDPPAVAKHGLTVHVDDSYHVDVGGDQKRWKCRMCEKSYTSKYNLVTHILGHSGIKPHGCGQCGKLFKQLSHLHTHMLTHQGARPHKCQVCHKAFTQTSHLKRHMMQHSDIKPYSCGVCGRGFAYPSELRAHELKHEKGQENVCVECGLDFPTLAQLKRHLNTHRGPTVYSCSDCEKTFQYPSQLQNHMMKHKDVRPHICTECGMEFAQSHHLKQHSLTHKGVKEHKCRICGREFTLLANMKRHVLIHTNIRAYQCHLCYKSFVQKQTLKAHMIVHSNIKPYKCKLCGKEFNRMHNLMGHMHLHSDSKPFKCLYCPSKFTLKGNLTRHIKVKHGIMDRGLDVRGLRRRGRLHLSVRLENIDGFYQEEPFDLSCSNRPRPPHPSLSDGESVRGSSCQEEDEDPFLKTSQSSPVDPTEHPFFSKELFYSLKSPHSPDLVETMDEEEEEKEEESRVEFERGTEREEEALPEQ
ncbi:hypothetical protein AGOR_G00048390 [Albula goreensis]|uniref:Zinc finger protein 710 n=1 Tax=Albula goreensis TaxID=1534307 RepID=A0A8T3DT65_9TELE|nr:hypothetical protein AGOR_G00048390 [Albula goreensis]